MHMVGCLSGCVAGQTSLLFREIAARAGSVGRVYIESAGGTGYVDGTATASSNSMLQSGRSGAALRHVSLRHAAGRPAVQQAGGPRWRRAVPKRICGSTDSSEMFSRRVGSLSTATHPSAAVTSINSISQPSASRSAESDAWIGTVVRGFRLDWETSESPATSAMTPAAISQRVNKLEGGEVDTMSGVYGRKFVKSTGELPKKLPRFFH